MTDAKWSPQIARAMHELSNAAPAAPAVTYLRGRHQSPSRQPRVAVTLAAAAIALAAVVVLAVVVGGAEKMSVLGPMPAVDVNHTRIEVALEGQLECDTPIDTAGTFATMVIDTYSDRVGRQWRNTVTYPDGTTVDLVATGSAVYPTGLFRRGDYKGSALGCVGPADEEFILVADPTPGGFFTLNVSAELSPDEFPFVREFDDWSSPVAGDHVDSRGRPSELWEQRVEGLAGYGTDSDAANLGTVQISSWWVDPVDGRTVTERRFSNTIDQLGSATETSTLVVNETITVPPDFFDTTGYQQLATYPRPTLDGSPTDDTIVSVTAPTNSGGEAVLLPDPATSGVTVISDETYGSIGESRGAALAPDGTVFGFVAHRPTGGALSPDGDTRIIAGHGVHAVADGSAPTEIYRTIADSCASVTVTTAEEEMWSDDTLALLASITFDGARASIELPAGWIDLGSSRARPQHIVELSVISQGQTVRLVLQQMVGVPAGWFLSANETAPRAVDLDGSTAWIVDGATTPGWHSIIGERDGIAFSLSGMLAADGLAEIARSLLTITTYVASPGDAVIDTVAPSADDQSNECGTEPKLTVIALV